MPETVECKVYKYLSGYKKYYFSLPVKGYIEGYAKGFSTFIDNTRAEVDYFSAHTRTYEFVGTAKMLFSPITGTYELYPNQDLSQFYLERNCNRDS